MAWLIDWNMSNKGLETLMIPDKNSNSKKQNRAGHHFIVKVHHLIFVFFFFESNVRIFIKEKEKPTKYTESVLQQHKSRTQITTVKKIGER